MYEFAQAHKEIELRFLATLRLIDFNRDEVDVAIRFGLGNDKDVYARPLIKEWVTLMMTPEMAKEIKTPEKLADATLVHHYSVNFFKAPTDWPAWAKAQGITIDTDHGPRFSQADHAIDAAIAGAEVVLGRVSLTTRTLESRRLVAPFELGLISEAQFRFTCPWGNEKRPHIAVFEAWVTDKIKTSAKFVDGRRLIDARDLI
jgi:LysR family glycine cleavage system transcriptional activator